MYSTLKNHCKACRYLAYTFEFSLRPLSGIRFLNAGVGWAQHFSNHYRSLFSVPKHDQSLEVKKNKLDGTGPPPVGIESFLSDWISCLQVFTGRKYSGHKSKSDVLVVVFVVWVLVLGWLGCFTWYYDYSCHWVDGWWDHCFEGL